MFKTLLKLEKAALECKVDEINNTEEPSDPLQKDLNDFYRDQNDLLGKCMEEWGLTKQ